MGRMVPKPSSVVFSTLTVLGVVHGFHREGSLQEEPSTRENSSAGQERPYTLVLGRSAGNFSFNQSHAQGITGILGNSTGLDGKVAIGAGAHYDEHNRGLSQDGVSGSTMPAHQDERSRSDLKDDANSTDPAHSQKPVTPMKINGEVSRQYVEPALEVMMRAVKDAEAADGMAQHKLTDASVSFRMARGTKFKADGDAKIASDIEAQLIDTKATALRSVAAARQMNVAAARAAMDSDQIVAAPSNGASLKRDAQSAEAAVLRAEHNLAAVQERLGAAEKAAIAAHHASFGATNTAMAAQREMKAAQSSAEQAASEKALVEQQVSQKSDQILRLAAAFSEASAAKAKALKDYTVKRKELVDATHVSAMFKSNKSSVHAPLPRPAHPLAHPSRRVGQHVA